METSQPLSGPCGGCDLPPQGGVPKRVEASSSEGAVKFRTVGTRGLGLTAILETDLGDTKLILKRHALTAHDSPELKKKPAITNCPHKPGTVLQKRGSFPSGKNLGRRKMRLRNERSQIKAAKKWHKRAHLYLKKFKEFKLQKRLWEKERFESRVVTSTRDQPKKFRSDPKVSKVNSAKAINQVEARNYNPPKTARPCQKTRLCMRRKTKSASEHKMPKPTGLR
jgi:hypothetical protein